jgi:hypothetical protein
VLQYVLQYVLGSAIITLFYFSALTIILVKDIMQVESLKFMSKALHNDSFIFYIF